MNDFLLVFQLHKAQVCLLDVILLLECQSRDQLLINISLMQNESLGTIRLYSAFIDKVSYYPQALSVEITQFPLLEELYIDNNKLIVLPPEIGSLKNLKVLVVDYNMLVSVPGMTFGCFLFSGLCLYSHEYHVLLLLATTAISMPKISISICIQCFS